MTYVLLLVAVFLFVLLNGFFVAAEFALVRSRRSRMEQLDEEGARGAALAVKQIDRIDEYLSACQLGITMASLGHRLPRRAGDRRACSRRSSARPCPHGVDARDLARASPTCITTALHITIGEQVPKIYAIVHAEGIARRTAARRSSSSRRSCGRSSGC